MRVCVDFALIHQALLVIVKKLDGVLDGDHVLFAFAVDLVKHGGEGGGLTGACRAGNKHESSRFVAQSLHHQRQSESVEALDFPWNRTEDGAHSAALIENVAAEASQIFQAKRKVQLQIFFEAVLLRIRQNAISERFGVGGRQRRHVQRPEPAMHTDTGRAVRGDMEIAASHLDHLLQQFTQRDSSHQSPSIYKTVSRRTSSMVVCPSATLIKPLRRRVIIPCSMAFFFSSSAEAPTRINSRSSSLISMTS